MTEVIRVDERADHRRAHSVVPESADVVIIGSGLGGLTAGAYLSRRGLRVAIFEAHYVAGGCGTQFSRGPRDQRYHFDVGVHYIGDCGEGGAIPRILRGVGVEIEYAKLDQDGFDTLVFPDLRFRIPADIDLYRDRVLALFPQERRAIDAYVRLLVSVRSVIKAVRRGGGRPTLRQFLPIWRDVLRFGRHKSSTIGAVLDAIGARDPRLRAVLLGQNIDYGLPPAEASAVIHFGVCGHYFSGAYYPKGGGQVPADRLAAVIEQNGGTIHLRRPVERIRVEAGRATGVVLESRAGAEGPTVRARAVLSNADLKQTLLRLVEPGHLPSELVARTRRHTMSGALFQTFLGVRGDLRAKGMGATNYLVFDDDDVATYYQGRRTSDGLYLPRTCFVTSASMKDPENARHHAPEGITNVEVMAPVPPVGTAWGTAEGGSWAYKKTEAYQRQKLAIEENLVARLDALFPGAAASIVYRESATPMTLQRFTRADGGAAYGLAASPDQFVDRRPGYRTPLAGLYLTGASTRVGPGMVGALLNGRQAAAALASDLGCPLEG